MKGKVINFNKARIMAYMERYEKTGVLHKNFAMAIGGEALPSYTRNFKSFTYASIALKNQRIRARNNIILDFENDLELLKDNFETESAQFMFPTVLSQYRRGMNPVRALYYELQKTLFQFDKTNEVHLWMISLFSDEDWYKSLIKALNTDYRAISKFQQKHLPQGATAKSVERELSVLNNVKENIKHFKEVFVLMKDNENRYLK